MVRIVVRFDYFFRLFNPVFASTGLCHNETVLYRIVLQKFTQKAT